VARQPEQQDAGTQIAVGLTLPPPATRKRVSLVVPSTAILRQSDPPALSQALDTVDCRYKELVQRVLDICEDANVTPYVYGSALWQTVSKRTYMTDTSDLDVLFVCNKISNVHLLLERLVEYEGSIPRLDGELVVPSGWAAAWREIAAAGKAGEPGTVLAKSTYEVRLIRLNEFLVS
jgi:phosphoribosyl-dephospho-CoA transferase